MDLVLKPGREKSIQRRHPWIYSGAIGKIIGDQIMGGIGRVLDQKGRFLAWASYNPHSQICARIWSWVESENIDRAFLEKRIKSAVKLRSNLNNLKSCDCYRLVHGESDNLPGLIIDKYGDYLVIQILAAGMEFFRDTIVEICNDELGYKDIYERSDVDVRELEGLPKRSGILSGDEPPGEIIINENEVKYLVDIKNGQKTGFYLDQRDNRLKFRDYSENKYVLNCFSYTGGFTLNALLGGARQIISIDSSSEAIAKGKQNIAINQFDENRTEWLVGDVFSELRRFRDARQSFDLIVLDPPKFAPTIKSAEKAARGYKDINLLAFKLLNPGGYLFTFSCSGGVTPELFQKIVADAALDADVHARIIDRLYQSSDHPTSLNFPEGTYLKGLICAV